MDNVPPRRAASPSQFDRFMESVRTLPESEQMAAIVAACKNRFDSEVTECEVELTDPGGREVVTLTLHAPGAMIELPMERSDAVEIWKEIGAALGLPGLPEKPG